MLKKFLSIFMCAAIVLTCVPASNAYAAPDGVLITQIQAGGGGGATQELVVIYNNSLVEVDITGWCLTNKNNVTIACFTVASGQAMYLPPQKHAVVASHSFPAVSVPTVVYNPISQSSGSITGSADTVSLVDHAGVLVDRQSWTATLASGSQFVRRGSFFEPIIYVDTDMPTDWVSIVTTIVPLSEVEIDTTEIDLCPNIDGAQLLLPSGKLIDISGNCVDRIVLKLYITELLPNADGSDSGTEFIELYNPNEAAVDLVDYRLYVGLQLQDSYEFPFGSMIPPHTYKAFSNAEIPYSLLNTSSKAALALRDGTVVSEAPAYQDPKDGQAWAYIDSTWQYSTHLTPGAENIASTEDLVAELEATLQPCAANQYRSLETNRCRLISSKAASITPCKDNQYRSEETNRCRNIATEVNTVTPCDTNQERNPDTGRCRKVATATTPAPCKEGQERNSETNRCRTITTMPKADYGVLGAKTDSDSHWYVWAAVIGVLLLAVAYAIWEWHHEIGRFLKRLYHRVREFVRFRR